MENHSQTTNHPHRRSCCATGCIAAVVFILVMVLWIGSGFIFWRGCKITLPDGSGTVVFQARLNKIPSAEWDRRVHLNTRRFHDAIRCIPMDISGADPVNVYWYPVKNGSGPYLRFRDPIWEYMVDLKHGKTLLLQRHTNGSAFVGEISHGTPSRGIYAIIDGKPARKLEHSVASNPGTYLGRVTYPYKRFIPSRISPEIPITLAF